MRLLAPQALVYTEMHTVGAIKNNASKALFFDPVEHPIALQLGGSEPNALAECASLAERAGYDEINLNLGCPSDKVQSGHFGACLMAHPKLVSECIRSIKRAVSIPVTAKTRIGIDQFDSYEFFRAFALQLVDAGCDKLIIHARKAWLTGLNPKQNRTIPPVQYDYVYRLKEELPQTSIIINGNISSIEQIVTHLNYVDGAMLGRLACDNPYRIAEIHNALYPEQRLLKRSEVFQLYMDYMLNDKIKNTSQSLLVKPIFNLAFSLPGAVQWRKKLMSFMQLKNKDILDELLGYLLNQELLLQAEYL
jgi:tRNA-dihydrouridine synthase A